MARDMAMAGHMGVERTFQRIRRSFWWPGVTKMLDTIGNAKYTSTLDLVKGYWQIPMDKQDCQKTAFSNPVTSVINCWTENESIQQWKTNVPE